MFFQMIAVIVIDALILRGALYLIARHEADYSIQKCAMVVAPIVVAPMIIAAVLMAHLSPQLLLVVIPLILIPFAVYMVAKFCWVQPLKAILVVAVFYGCHFALNAGIAAVRHYVHKPVH